jgi:hypothetical protein
MLRKLIVVAVATLMGLGAYCATDAQDDLRATVLGTWQGRAIFGESAPAVLTFSESAGALRWTYSYKYDAGLWGEAEGTVTSFSPPALTLAGAWTKHAVSAAVGTGVKFALTVAGDQMTGSVTAAMNNTPVQLSLTRKR